MCDDKSQQEVLNDAVATANQYDLYCEQRAFTEEEKFDEYGNLQSASCSTGKLSNLRVNLRKVARAMANNFRRIHRMGILRPV